MTEQELKAIESRCAAATPGPWMWDMRTHSKMCQLETTHSGHYFVMGFDRWGTQSACPIFQKYNRYEGPVNERGSHGMIRADKLAKSLPGKEHHDGFDDYIDHPDAIFIEHSKADMDALLSEIHRLTTDLAALRERCEVAEQKVEYKIYVPSDDGYDVKGYYYECTCGANYIDAEQAQEWECCPNCGKHIGTKENYACTDCENAYVDLDVEDYWCPIICEIVGDACADGCQKYKQRGPQEQKGDGQHG